MSLLSNSLFLDSEYKADCEYKINYYLLLHSEESEEYDESNDENLNTENESDDEASNTDVEKEEAQKVLTYRIIKKEINDNRPYIDDGTCLHGTKKISDEYYKLLIEPCFISN